MEFKYGFNQDPAMVEEYLKGGCFLSEEEGVWLTFETKPEIMKGALPPVLDYVNPYVTIYCIRIGRTTFGPAFMESAILLPASFRGQPGMYGCAFLLNGPGAESATVMGREIYGINKKLADDIKVTKLGDVVTASIVRGGKRILDAQCRIGDYNDHEVGMQCMGMPKKGDGGPGDSFFFTYDAHQDENMNMKFDAVHLNDTVGVGMNTEDWIPGSIEKLTMEESANDPWSYFEMVRPIGFGYAHQQLHMVKQIQYRNVGDPVANMAKLMVGKFDMAAFGQSTRFLNAITNK